jgi:hypothetical protein
MEFVVAMSGLTPTASSVDGLQSFTTTTAGGDDPYIRAWNWNACAGIPKEDTSLGATFQFVAANFGDGTERSTALSNYTLG